MSIFDGPVDAVGSAAREAALNSEQRELEEKQRIEAEKQRQKEEEAKAAASGQPQNPKQDPAAAKQDMQPRMDKPAPNPIVEAGTAIVGGTVDFIQDIDNQYVPFLDIPDEWSPVNETQWGKALRSASSVVIPTIVGTILTKKAAVKLAGAQNLAKIPKPMQIGADVALGAGVGVGVDYTSRESSQENLAQTLRESFPDQFGWLPDDITTLDTDSPDVKRRKNVMEGLGLGILADLLIVGTTAARTARGLKTGTKITPLDDAAKQFEAANPSTAVRDGVDELYDAAEAREAVKAKRGIQDIEADPAGEVPTPDVNTPLYDANEQAVYTKPVDAVRQNDIDAARISGNVDSVDGRMSPLLDSADVRDANLNDHTSLNVKRRIVAERAAMGKYDVETMNGRKITNKMIMEADKEDMKVVFKNLDEAQNESIIKELNGTKVEWLRGVESALDPIGMVKAARMAGVLMEVMDPENLRVSGRLARTTAGQIAENAQALRELDSAGIDTSRQAQLQDELLEFLVKETAIASYARGRGLQLMKLAKQAWNESNPALLKQIKEETEAALSKASSESKQFVETLAKLRETSPESYRAMTAAFDLSDGKVATMEDMIDLGKRSLSTRGLFIQDPARKSLFAEEIISGFYHSILSSPRTSVTAGSGNLFNLAMKPLTTFVGAAFDREAFRRAAAQYGALGDTLGLMSEHYKTVIKRMINDPKSVHYAVQDGVVEQSEKAMKFAETYAKAEAASGNYGPMMKYNVVKTMHDFNNHPWVRYTANLLSSVDAGTIAAVSHIEARGRAYDMLATKFPGVSKFSDEQLKLATEQIRKSMMNKEGYYTDKGVEYISRELSLNLQDGTASKLNEFTEKMPILKTVLTFPRTTMNMLSYFAKHTRLAAWATESGRILRAADSNDLAKAAEIMKARGRTTFSEGEWKTLVAETKGRLAFGDMVTITGTMSALAGAHTGDGPSDPNKKRDLMKIGWQPRSFRMANGQYMSYNFLGPLGDILALTANITDAFKNQPTPAAEALLDKLAMTIGSSLVDRSILAGIAPLLNPNEATLQRMAAQQVNSFAPWGGLRNQLGQLLNPGLREIEQEFNQLARNRNAWLDNLDPAGALPYAHDMFDGSRIREYDWFGRAMNLFSPMQLNPTEEPHRRWLVDIGYDGIPELKKDRYSNDYSPEALSQLTKIMGDQGILDKRIKALYKRKDIQQETNIYNRYRAEGVSTKELDAKKSLLWKEISNAFKIAKQSAEATLYQQNPDIAAAGQRKRILELRQKQRDFASVDELLKMNK